MQALQCENVTAEHEPRTEGGVHMWRHRDLMEEERNARLQVTPTGC